MISTKTVTSWKEFTESRKVSYKAFKNNIDGFKDEEKGFEEMRTSPHHRSIQQWDKTVVTADEEGVFASLQPIYYQINYNNITTSMVGIGAVCCIKKGTKAIHDCFFLALNDAYAKKVPFSYLYPFSGKYYNQFGYSYGIMKKDWSIPRLSFPYIENTEVKLNDNDFKRQREYAKKYNFSVVRDEIDWVNLLKDFVVREMDDFLTYHIVDNNIVVTSQCSTPKTLSSLLAKLPKVEEKITITLPSWYEAGQIMEEMNLERTRATCSYSAQGMSRIVNLEAAVALLRPTKDDSVTIKVSDELIAENNGIFTFCSKKGKVKLIKGNSSYDYELTIDKLSRLFTIGDGSVIFPYNSNAIFDYF